MTEPLWRDLTHQQVWDQVHAGPGPYVSDGAATAWSNAQTALRQIDSDLDAAITRAAGWTGPAADAARSGLTPLGGWAVDATGSAGRAAASLTEHQMQVAWVRANLPEPVPPPGIDPPVPLSDAGVDPAVLQDWTVAVGRNTALADQAFHVMDTYATNTALIQQQVPAWTPPPAVTVAVADRPPPSGSAMTSPRRASGTSPTTVGPAAALSPAPVGGTAGGTAGQNTSQRPVSDPTGADGSGTGRPAPPPLSTITPTASGAAATPGGGRASSARDGSALPVAGAVAGRVLPDGPGVIRGLPDSAALSAGSVGVLDGSGARPGTAAPRGSAGDAQSVPRGLPDGSEPGTGVLRGGPDVSVRGGVRAGRSGPSGLPLGQGSSNLGIPPRTGSGDVTPGGAGSGAAGGRGGNLGSDAGLGFPGGRVDPGGTYLGGRSAETGVGYLGGRPDLGTGVLGGPPGDPSAPGRGGVTPTDPKTAAAPGRPGAEGYPGYVPTAGIGLGSRGDTRRTPDYLVRTYDFFADDRRIPGPLITPEVPLPLRT